jgi:hypothetical protein
MILPTISLVLEALGARPLERKDVVCVLGRSIG